MKNILESFLDALEVRYTKRYVRRLYEEHPHRGNMYGLKQMLAVYGVRALGVYMEDKDLLNLSYPCIFHTGNDFVIGLESNGSRIVFWQQGKKKTSTHEAFKSDWTGNVLVVEDLEKAGEPDFKQHRWEDLQFVARCFCLPTLLVFATGMGCVNNWGELSFLHWFCMSLDLVGLCLCFMLMQKQLLGESKYGDKVCSFFHHADCNSILEGAYAKIFGVSWSEIGFGYFMANILLLSLYPSGIDVLRVVNGLAMCYGVWSIYYQWRVAKNWCVLCVSVQAVVWCTGIMAACHIRGISLSAEACLWSAMVLVACVMLVHQYAFSYQSDKERIRMVQQYKGLKANSVVAKALIESSTYYKVSEEDSSVFFGNKEAHLHITVLSNPHCNPCARLHKRVEDMLKWYGDDLCVQYIFTAFSEKAEDSCRYLISCYDKDNPEATLKIYGEWYAGGKNRYESIVKEHADSIHTDEVEQEVQKHFRWCKGHGFTATPTVLVNGYLLPREYDIEDLVMLTNCQIEYPRKNIVHDISGRSTTPLGAESLSAEESV